MTLVTGTVQDLGYDGMEGTLWARPAWFRSDGQVVYAPERKPYTITGGVVSADLAPGPAVLELQVGSHARGTFEVVIPEADTTLADLLETLFVEGAGNTTSALEGMVLTFTSSGSRWRFPADSYQTIYTTTYP